MRGWEDVGSDDDDGPVDIMVLVFDCNSPCIRTSPLLLHFHIHASIIDF